MRLQTAPLTTSIVDSKKLNKPWEVYFRNSSKNLEDSTKVIEKNNVKYVINGCILQIVYDGSGDVFDFPAQPYKQILPIFLNGLPNFFEITEDQKSITFPDNCKINATILIKQQNR